MHIDSDKLVGTYVSDRYSEKGTVTIVLTDGDSTPTREYTRYKYVQTEQLTAIGVAVKDYGAVLVPEITIALFESGVLNPVDFGVFVKFNDDYYSISLSEILEADVSAPIEFEESSFDDYPTVTFNSTLPPFSVGNAGQVPTVDENGKVGWGDIPEELPAVTGNTGKFLGVNDDATGVEWKNVPNELPAIASSDSNKVLKVNNSATGVEWGTVASEKKYVHNIHLYKSAGNLTAEVSLILINTKASAYDSANDVRTAINTLTGTNFSKYISASGMLLDSNSSPKRMYIISGLARCTTAFNLSFICKGVSINAGEFVEATPYNTYYDFGGATPDDLVYEL